MVSSLRNAIGTLVLGLSVFTGIAFADDADTPIRIAAWNVEHLADEDGEGCRARQADNYAVLRTYIRNIDADVWLLQEVENTAALERIFDGRWTLYVDDREIPNRGWPPCYQNNGRRLGMQRTAIAIRSGLSHTRLPDIDQLDVNGYGGLRPAVRVRLELEPPVELLSVHLKSGCHSGTTRDDCPILFEQLRVLEDWLDQRSLEGHAVIVGGDFNRRMEQADDIFWADLNDGDPTPLHIAGDGEGPRCDPRYREFIDFFVLNDQAWNRYRQSSFTEHTFDAGIDPRPSDHCALVIEFG